MKKIAILVSVFLISAQILFAQQFSEQTGIVFTGVGNSSVDWGDYNNDGYLDIVMMGQWTAGLVGQVISKVYKNNGDNTFTEQTQISLTGVSRGTVAWGDYHNDGDLDILVTGFTNNNNCISKIYNNNGNNSFSKKCLII